MSGWKTKAAAALAILYGIAGWLLDLHGFDAMANYLIGALGMLGVGHKVEKAGAAWEGRNHAELEDLVRRDRADR